ncbi:hypothetical protein [Vibrio sp. HN007]|uniref:hypothetical protein n=1 Tax=Vibrio iocasae TaxID=3098914 RepID=UPI0035D4D9BF
MKEHGSFSYEIRGKVIFFFLTGAFNEYGMASCLAAQKDAIETFADEPCFLLVDCTTQIGATPETYELVDKFYADLNYENLSAIALVHTQPTLKHLENRDIPMMKNHNSKVFSDIPSALSWFDTQSCRKSIKSAHKD